MKLPPLQDSVFVYNLSCAIFRTGPNILLTSDQSVPFYMKLPPLQDSVFVYNLSCAIFRTGPNILLTSDQSVNFI
jgi:hypothetical protein